MSGAQQAGPATGSAARRNDSESPCFSAEKILAGIEVYSVRDLTAVEPKTYLRGHAKEVLTVAFSSDGQTVASASQDQIRLWNVASGDLKITIKGHTDDVTSVGFSPDSKQLVSTSMDRTVRIWNIADAKELANFKVETVIEKKDPKGKTTHDLRPGAADASAVDVAYSLVSGEFSKSEAAASQAVTVTQLASNPRGGPRVAPRRPSPSRSRTRRPTRCTSRR